MKASQGERIAFCAFIAMLAVLVGTVWYMVDTSMSKVTRSAPPQWDATKGKRSSP